MSTETEQTSNKMTLRVALVVSPTWLAALDDWRFVNRIASRSEAIRFLVESGMTLSKVASTGVDFEGAPAEASSNQETVGDHQNAQ